ncbi:phosphatidylserine/phosphatidylglycerophosphate/cardiolipin synthase family protein [Ruminococcus sp.]|uniref:phospholipase D-like domain-containing protein n=1 Tax=Ruminococcus sp. TaxID=41978 RepID=UPI0025E10198|nr:phosphatidylserine/phosphatidylglycerophosphate/cardiolipin synthase family protein [Ruminococcus sp.]MBQ8966153.1 phosphatidylserine/phosphatidylglycerophosphate/cardiolipin synthase family protein [Ruminococcus sp.]
MCKRVFALLAAVVMLGSCGAAHRAESSEKEVSSAAVTSVTTEDTGKAEEPDVQTQERPEMPMYLTQEDLGGEGSVFYELTGCRYPVYKNTEVSYCPTGEAFYEALLEELAKAEDFIFMEYFIVKDGQMLNGIMDVLEDRMAAGVEVRLICDGFQQNDAFAEAMNSRGINCKLYREADEVSMNRRDHRKLTVIDGKTAFMGGVNIGDEYINVEHPYGRWKDAAILLRGEAVRSCTELFFEQWEGGSKLADCEKYLDLAEPVTAEGCVQPYGESPFDGLDSAREIYLEMIRSADDYLYITAPYLNIDDEVETALREAADRGTEVIMIIPGHPDKRYMELVARKHYLPLIEAGVQIYKYSPGFIHSKVFVSDDKRATVGSINLNNRSFYLDFECGAVLTNVSCIADIKADILSTLEECEQLTADNVPELTAEEQLELIFYTNIDSML